MYFNQEILPYMLYQTLVRDHRLKSCPASPIDEWRAGVNEDVVREYFATFCRIVSGTPAHFMWDMDEMGHQKWSDARDAICFAPSHLSGRKMDCSVPRSGKRITLIVCISADGSYMRPALVISRQTLKDELFLHGFTSDKVEIYS
jgi:hypothetical protein